MPQKDSTNKTIGNRRATWLEKAFQAGRLDAVQLNTIKCTKCTTALSGKGRAQCFRRVENGNVIYSCNHCLRHNTACSVNPTNIKKRMRNESVTQDDHNPKRIETGESSQSQGKQQKTEVVVAIEVKKEAVTASQELSSGKGKGKETMVPHAESPDLEIGSDYGISEIDDINWKMLEASVKPSTPVASTQEQVVKEAGKRMEQAYSLSYKAESVEQKISALQTVAWKLRSLSRTQMVEAQKLLKKY